MKIWNDHKPFTHSRARLSKNFHDSILITFLAQIPHMKSTHIPIDFSIQNKYRTMGKTVDDGKEMAEEKFVIFLQSAAWRKAKNLCCYKRRNMLRDKWKATSASFSPLNILEVIKTKIKVLMKDRKPPRKRSTLFSSLSRNYILLRFLLFWKTKTVPKNFSTHSLGTSLCVCLCLLFNICIRKLLIVYSNKHWLLGEVLTEPRGAGGRGQNWTYIGYSLEN